MRWPALLLLTGLVAGCSQPIGSVTPTTGSTEATPRTTVTAVATAPTNAGLGPTIVYWRGEAGRRGEVVLVTADGAPRIVSKSTLRPVSLSRYPRAPALSISAT